MLPYYLKPILIQCAHWKCLCGTLPKEVGSTELIFVLAGAESTVKSEVKLLKGAFTCEAVVGGQPLLPRVIGVAVMKA